MSAFSAQVAWTRGDAPFTDNRYSRAHVWSFDGGQVIPASSSPHVVPPPYSVVANVDPEEAFIAALSSCHMLFFLSLAAKAGLVVDSYVDEAKGAMTQVGGTTMVSTVDLAPQVTYVGQPPAPELVADLHHRAHAMCFLANSVKTAITIHPR
jgi:organic hydroperoxide reductase OsmC/OhrA